VAGRNFLSSGCPVDLTRGNSISVQCCPVAWLGTAVQWHCPVAQRLSSGLQFTNAEAYQRSGAAPWLVRLPSSLYAMPSLISLLRFRLIVFLSLSVARPMMARAASSAVTPVDLAAFEPFGRVKDNKLKSGEGVLQLVGCDTKTGALVRYNAQLPDWRPTLEEPSGVKVIRYDELRPDWGAGCSGRWPATTDDLLDSGSAVASLSVR
jgi:hypothetical protein